MKMIKLKLVNPTNPEGDTVVFMDPREIKQVVEASTLDRRQRPEIASLIFNQYGTFAVRECAAVIAEKIEEASL